MTDIREGAAQAIRAAREGSTGWLVQRLTGQLDRAMDAALAPHGLTVQRFAIVMTVLENEGLTQSEIGERFRAPAYQITRSIDALAADGFLERRPHPTSRRTNTVHATRQSLALVPTLVKIVETVNADLLAGLKAEECAQMHDLLGQMLASHTLGRQTSED